MSNLYNQIYKYTPIFIQNMAITAYGVGWYKRRYGGVFLKELNEFKLRERLSTDEWHMYKQKKLIEIFTHSYQHVDYYKKVFKEVGLELNDIQNFNLSDLNKIPTLDKDTFRQLGTTSLVSSVKEKNGIFLSSSGSTGTPTKILVSHKMHQKYSAANEARSRNWAGVNYKSARGMIGGRRIIPEANAKAPFHRYNLIEKQVYYSAYHISPQNVIEYVKPMFKYNIEYMTGYAVSNYLLARLILEQNIKVPKLKAVITSSEKLTNEMRAVIMEAYQCKVYDGWSGVESCAMVSECEYGSLHVSEDVGIIEILDEHGLPVSEGHSGSVYCTGFLNYDQPLIRYKIGDCMTIGSGKCDCGRNMPIIKEIDGRIEDVIIGQDGRKMVRFHGVFINIDNIECAQVVQHTINEIEIIIQNKISLNEQELDIITNRLKSQLGNIIIKINQHQLIEQTSNGKYKAVISKLKNQ